MNILDRVARFAGYERARPPASEIGHPIRLGGGYYPLGINTTNVVVTEDTSLTLPAVFAAVNTISKDLAALPFGIYRRTDNGYLRPATDHPLWDLFLRSPDGGNQTPMAWRQTLALHMLVWGNAYAEIVRDGRGVIQSVELRDPCEVQPVMEDDLLSYRFSSQTLPIPREKVVHVRALSKCGYQGYSPVMLCQQAVGLGLTGERFAGQFLSKGLQMSGLLYTPDSMDNVAREELKTSLAAQIAGSKGFGMLAVPPGCKFEPTSADPTKAQLLESRRYQVLEIARLFQVPPHKLMDFTGAAYSTIEASNLEYTTACLQPWAELVEQSFNLRLLSLAEQRSGYTFRHDFKALMRGDSASRAAYFKSMHDMGVLSSNQIAVEEGFEPHAGGDTHWRPLNMFDDSKPLDGEVTP